MEMGVFPNGDLKSSYNEMWICLIVTEYRWLKSLMESLSTYQAHMTATLYPEVSQDTFQEKHVCCLHSDFIILTEQA